jgi:nicotinate-nucleotide adenylyltransferase|nr:MAG TPA: nicotinate (nicotinamide) nucleotide adenylyltransferase [Caudoviricetes sp.]
MKVGFLLGTFDPIHMGHLYMITSALNDNLVDEVVVVPTMQNVWKETQAINFQHRCFMVQLAIDEIDNCTLSSIDYRTPDPHYSYQTLQLLKEDYPDEDLYLIVGADIVDDIINWKEGQWILDNFKLIVVNRTGSSFKASVEGYISNTFDISSTMIRYLIKDGKQIYPLVPKAISQYIHRFSLYNG